MHDHAPLVSLLEPARKDGKLVAVAVDVEVNFRLF